MISQTSITWKPQTAEANYCDHLVATQCPAGKLWFAGIHVDASWHVPSSSIRGGLAVDQILPWPIKPHTQEHWRRLLVSGTAIGLLNRIGTPWAPCHDPRAVPERFFAAWQGSLSCWRGAAVAISRFLSRSFHYNEMITVIHFTRQRSLTLNCDKPAKSASSSSLLLGTMLLVDGTKVQQGQWTPSFRPRLFSGDRERHQLMAMKFRITVNGSPGVGAHLDRTPSP